MPPPSILDSAADDADKRKLETPLAAMLPSKYADIDVTELFPDFRHGKVTLSIFFAACPLLICTVQVLRFSRLFGPGKPTSLPQIWRNIRKKRKKQKRKESGEYEAHSDDEKPRGAGWKFNYAERPPREQWDSDDEVGSKEIVIVVVLSVFGWLLIG